MAGTTVEDVLHRAHVSASQLYHYFGGKAGLVTAVVDYQADAAPDRARYPDGLDSIEALQEWCDAAIAVQLQRAFIGGCDLGSLASELAETGDTVRQQLAAAFARWEQPLQAGLRTMHARGDLECDADPDELATALLAALQGGILLTQTRRSIEPLQAALATAMFRIRSLVTS